MLAAAFSERASLLPNYIQLLNGPYESNCGFRWTCMTGRHRSLPASGPSTTADTLTDGCGRSRADWHSEELVVYGKSDDHV